MTRHIGDLNPCVG